MISTPFIKSLIAESVVGLQEIFKRIHGGKGREEKGKEIGKKKENPKSVRFLLMRWQRGDSEVCQNEEKNKTGNRAEAEKSWPASNLSSLAKPGSSIKIVGEKL